MHIGCALNTTFRSSRLRTSLLEENVVLCLHIDICFEPTGYGRPKLCSLHCRLWRPSLFPKTCRCGEELLYSLAPRIFVASEDRIRSSWERRRWRILRCSWIDSDVLAERGLPKSRYRAGLVSFSLVLFERSAEESRPSAQTACISTRRRRIKDGAKTLGPEPASRSVPLPRMGAGDRLHGELSVQRPRSLPEVPLR